MWDCKALPRPGATEHFDGEIIANWSYDVVTKMMVSYDMVECARKKCDYIRSKKLGGAMWWETSGDRKGDGSLVDVVAGELTKEGRGGLESAKNSLAYPMSRFDNIRTGILGE